MRSSPTRLTSTCVSRIFFFGLSRRLTLSQVQTHSLRKYTSIQASVAWLLLGVFSQAKFDCPFLQRQKISVCLSVNNRRTGRPSKCHFLTYHSFLASGLQCPIRQDELYCYKYKSNGGIFTARNILNFDL